MKTAAIQAEVNEINITLLEAELKGAIEGEVRFDTGSRAAYATDASNYRQVPIGVVVPKTRQDVIITMAICHKYKAPVISRGGGTSLAGQGCNVAVLIDMSKYYHNVIAIDEKHKLVKVEPGIVLDTMRHATEQQAGLTFGPDPATHSHCTIGGMMGNNSCGVHSVMAQFYGYGARTSDNTERLTLLTYDGFIMEVGPTSEEELEAIIAKGGRKGEIYGKLKNLRDKYADKIREKYPKIPRRVSGYNLDDLLPENGFNVARALVGSESTCILILDATLKLMPKPKERSLLVLGYPDVYAAGSGAPEAMKHQPVACEGLDDQLIGYMEKKGLHPDDISILPEGKGWLLVEFGGDTKAESDQKAQDLMADLKKGDHPPSMKLFDDPAQEQKLWEVRESGLGATAFVPGMKDAWPGWEDSAVHPGNVGEYLKELRALFDKYGYKAALYGHFGQGCIHCRIDFDLITKEGIDKYQQFTIEAAKLVLKYGGSVSGEHGDGQARADLLELMFGEELMQAFREFKEIWDPEWKMNPGKLVEPYGEIANLRFGTDYNPKVLETHFQFPEDDGNFAHATMRCVGVGKCRRHEGGTMCPSYMVTREEEDSTRGRTRMLFEMLQGEEIKDGWQSEEVKEALDLCLACKGCKGDCPVNVDMATYKSEFLSHYYEKKLRPRSAYAFGLIYWWARAASHFPGIVNFVTHNPLTSGLSKFIAGVAPERSIPKFAAQTFRDWFRENKKENPSRPKVILWADTFNNFFLPETLVAATEVLDAAGFEVTVPQQMLCCGRPLYDFGMLNMAKNLLREIMESLKDDIVHEVPIVGLEPSCVAVFRDELGNLFPNREDAKRLKKQVFTLAEFLDKKAPDFKIPEFKAKAVVHGHCHHKAIMKMDSDTKMLASMQLDYQMLDSGCCGMAGYFGYEAGKHYEVGLAAGERVLLPAVRGADKAAIIIADGFSCREQIEQGTGRKGLHTAQVLQMALREEKTDLAYPEKKYVDGMKLKSGSMPAWLIAGIGAMAFAAVWVITLKKK
ncbi:FAD-binding and (Fe-S)-binding domain-containing protein [Mucilaginibacter litoreus]|uniref:FAD-binding and (Fe-S)-binding domain-containing protein n=1 Tax=Mucilaginibacter litoreus TaxID=1048221 RepID=A0ABW3AWW4_9SPHI